MSTKISTQHEKTLQHYVFIQSLLTDEKCPVGKIFFLSWKKIIPQLENYFFPVGEF